MNATLASPIAFRDALRVDCDGTVRRFGDVQTTWQRRDFGLLDPGLMRAVGRSDEPTRMRFWFERSRGASKTSDIALACTWALAAAARPLRCYAYAADRDQSRRLLDAIETLLRLNRWLRSILSVQSNRIINAAPGHPGEGSVLVVESSDVPGSYGILPDLVVCDEVAIWPATADRLWHSIISSVAKRETCILICILNSGFLDSWQWTVREQIRTDPDWVFRRLKRPPPWISEQRIDEQRRLLPPTEFRRLVLNEWSEAGGDLLPRELIDEAVCLHRPQTQRVGADWSYAASVDLSTRKDRTAIVVVGVQHGSGVATLADVKTWTPERGREIDLSEVERTIVTLHKRFRFESVWCDEWQATLLRQNLQRANVPVHPVFLSGQFAHRMATAVLDLFNSRAIRLYPHDELLRDLSRLMIVARPAGYRIQAPRGADGHCDAGICLALCLPRVVELLHAYAHRKLPVPRWATNFDPENFERFGIQCDFARR